ncbi:hypothetical protein [Thermoproteus tenax]|uniref:Uncharacterized protein n=1 Tax=Thermoproteus tenax (strain ATCC 35583 / DSM 2078 / JCM 9277 / NBRC 100435 / Kra 1) TaxID=768679 RepID=G4RK22_THETK|nr:hypothetical protein [Thermoproteus tenax]CCC81917.1 conserved hypothetical protein [Thermoproteus tenax Kra 1]
MSKTSLPVDKDIAEEVSAAAKAQGLQESKVVSDSLKLAMALLRRGVTPTKALDLYKFFELLLAFDIIPAPLALLQTLAHKWNICEDRDVQEVLRDSGRKFGRLAASVYGSFSEAVSTAVVFFSYLPAVKITASRSDQEWRIAFTAPGEGLEKCFYYFVEEAAGEFGCRAEVKAAGLAVEVKARCN